MTRPPLDPYAILDALEEARLAYVVIGALARIIHGSGELTDGVDITPFRRDDNIARLGKALTRLDARTAGDHLLPDPATVIESPVTLLETNHGQLTIVATPDGTRGFDDLRRAAAREPLGHGLRPLVASPSDLLRMVNALARPHEAEIAETMRRVAELSFDRGLTR